MLSNIVGSCIEETRECVEECLDEAKLKTIDTNEVAFLGGFTNLRDVQDLIKSMFDEKQF